MGVLWALGGALLGGGVEFLDNLGVPWAWIDGIDMWIPLFALPGFFGGIAFSLVLGVAGHSRKFEELSLPKFAAWGAIGGLLLGGVALALGILIPVAYVLAVPATQLLVIVVVGGLAGVLAAMRPARRAARLDVLAAIRTE